MSYTLWSHGRLVGRTDLDLPHVLARVRMGFIEPAPDGERALADASGVPNALLELKRTSRRAGEHAPETQRAHDEVRAAFDRREALGLELRDANGRTIPVQWIQVNDLTDTSDEPPPDDSEVEFDWSEDDELEEDIAIAAGEMARGLAADAGAMDRFENFEWLDAPDDGEPVELVPQPWSPPDERWETMRYHTMVFLRSPTDLP